MQEKWGHHIERLLGGYGRWKKKGSLQVGFALCVLDGLRGSSTVNSVDRVVELGPCAGQASRDSRKPAVAMRFDRLA